MSERCLVHNKEMKYDKRSGFELCRLCEAERDPEPQGKEQEVRWQSRGTEHWSDYRCNHCGLALTNEWVDKIRNPTQVKAIEAFYRLASKIAKRDKWFIGGFLGAVWEEWNEKYPNKRLG